MAVALSFAFPLPTLVIEGGHFLAAAVAHQEELVGRSVVPQIAEAQEQLRLLKREDTSARVQVQDPAIATLLKRFSDLRKLARKAFPTDLAKLAEQFQWGINKPSGIEHVLKRARIALESARQPANAARLQRETWVTDDSDRLEEAIEAAAAVAKAPVRWEADPAAVEARHVLANQFFANITRIRASVEEQFPAGDAANAAIRAEFRLDSFPPAQA